MSGLFSPGSQTTTSQSSVLLAPQQKTLIDSAMPYLQKFAQNGINLPTSSSVAPFNATQQGAQQSILNNTGKMQTGADAGLAASNMALSPDILNVNSNPGLKGTIDAATRPIYDNLTRSVLPAVRSDATATGNFGGSRQGIAEGMAINSADQAAGDASNKIAFSGYQSGLDAMMKSLGLLPQTLASQTAPGSAMGAVGDASQQLQQQLMDEAKAQFLQKQTMPLDIGKELLNTVGAIPSLGATSSAQIPTPSLFQQLLGTGATIAGGAASLGYKPFA